MADLKITELTENTSPITTDIIPMVDDPAGTPLTQKVTLANLGLLLSLKSKVITATRDMSAISGDVSYTGVGFTPTAIIAFSAINASIQYSIGAVDSGKTEMNIGNGNATSNMYVDSTNLVSIWQGGGNQAGLLKTFDSDGFTLTWTKYLSPTGTLTMYFLCLR